jgi:hypothetical protein
VLRVYPPQRLTVPAGTFEAWRVTVASQAAWFAAEGSGAPRPLRFDHGRVVYAPKYPCI